MKRFVAILLLLICVPVQAQTLTVVDVSNLPDGTYLLTKQGGSASVSPITIIRPGPSPTPIPTPVPSTTMTETVRTATAAIPSYPKKEIHRRALAETIKFTLPFARGAPPADVRQLIKSVCDVAVEDEDKPKWAAWWASVNAKLDSLQLTPQTCEAAMLEIAAELLNGLPPAAADDDPVHALPPGLWEILLPLIIEMIKQWLLKKNAVLLLLKMGVLA